MAKEPWGYTLFCDDVREEITGKYSLIGVYRQDLIIQGTLPAKLSKLCLVVNYVQPANAPKLPLTLKVFLPGVETPISIDVDLSQIPDQAIEDPENQQIKFQAVMALADLLLQEAGTIKVRVYRNDVEIKCGGIKVYAMQPEEISEAPTKPAA
ncbi:MAG: hypothetical protein HY054_10255 [Proteobacteria bacterium]|nr:hypothetical protein [Pseudomonadota bacterium]